MPINLDYLRETANGNEAFIQEMLQIYSTQIREINNELLAAKESKDWDLLCKISHKMRGSIQIIGLTDLAEELKAFEQNLAAQPDQVDTEERVQYFIDKTLEADEALKAFK